MRFRTSPAADRDIHEIHVHGSENFGVARADAYLDLIEAALRRLSDFPELGRQRDDLDPPLRQLPVRSHIVFYQLIEDGIMVVRILDHSVDYLDLL